MGRGLFDFKVLDVVTSRHSALCAQRRMVPSERIELSTSPLPRVCSTTELRRHLRARCHRDAGQSRDVHPIYQKNFRDDKESQKRLRFSCTSYETGFQNDK